jgi:hypothetical protein
VCGTKNIHSSSIYYREETDTVSNTKERNIEGSHSKKLIISISVANLEGMMMI